MFDFVITVLSRWRLEFATPCCVICFISHYILFIINNLSNPLILHLTNTWTVCLAEIHQICSLHKDDIANKKDLQNILKKTIVCLKF